MKNYAYFNGKIISTDKIKISPYDLGIHRGYGAFDLMCTQNGKVFLLDDHWKRFLGSAKELGIKVPVTKKEFGEIIEKLLKINKFEKANVRAVITGGISEDTFCCQPGQETFFILVAKFTSLLKEYYEKGAHVITMEYSRDFPWAKLTNYVAAIKKHKHKVKNKALEIIYINQGRATEASTSNFFIVKKGKLITTKEGILYGITRKVVIELAKKLKISVEERKINKKELFEADEIFLTATNKDIVPVVKVDGKKIGDGKVGKMTKILMEEFRKFAEKY
ncbi:MAG: amino acid aminotransferase [Candidatus Moranbacteria bacterium CG10_big_fil_rev_8_21_14_0_10_35_21]|nr:MAG: amino acid aminotransferase [Candidatus Moranbacteria bacterium CG10_big_fil_rev_8_21_14_0_10_35_21]PJA88577.1 MAG: amino acid aminotransferase [Candidatus Moranbacteria bacterium CG_4_9_14_3_um_filter_36_9]